MRAARVMTAAAAVPVLVAGLVGVAHADTVENDIDSVGDNTIVAGASTTVSYQIKVQGGGIDGQGGCNASDGTPVTINLSVPANVTATRTSLTFNSCNTLQGVDFDSSVVGDYPITVSRITDSGTGAYSNVANFTLHVSDPPPPPNTRPTVSVSGVRDGASYEIGHVPDATCLVTDAEDGSSQKAAAVTGTLSHGLGQLTATCDYTDQGGLAAETARATYAVVDTTDPTIGHALTSDGSKNANGWYRADVKVTFSCDDGEGSGIQSCVADGQSGSSVTLGEGENQSASGTATDWAGNTATDTASGINIDKTAPHVELSGGPASSYYFRNDPAAPTCVASDTLSGLDGACQVTGGGTAVGTHTYTATATDKAGNESSADLTYTVLPWTLRGFYTPVDMNGVWNTVKGGSTVPLKFEVFAGSELTSTSAVKTFTQRSVTCAGGATVDEIELVVTGGTSLRYDSSAGQFVQNWQTPKKAGACYTVTLTTQDGTAASANFMLR